MSGICAVLRLDGQMAGADAAAPILARLAARGPDGSAIVADGPAALGHALLASTPEALTEPMPFRHAASGCIITADARLDNRTELIAALGLDPAGRTIGDGELILHAYLKWGCDCPDQLLGDFAFVVWDAPRQRLFAARDKVGMRQLTYCYVPGTLLACATDPEALLGHPDVPRRLNEARVADFLEQFEAIDHVSTFYQDVLRLPPAHALTVENGALQVRRYWQLAPTPVIHRASDADYEAAFLDVFTQAVRARLRAPEGKLGAMLSGGMDSGSVTVVAARLLQAADAPPLKTFSGIDSDPACKESACVRDSAGTIAHIAPQIVSIDDADSFRKEVAELTRAQSDPFDGHMGLIRAIYLAARNSGVRVMLDGVSGDSTLGTGDMIAHHLAQGRLRAAWAEAREQEYVWGDELKATRTFAAALRRQVAPRALRTWRNAAWRKTEEARAAAASIVDPALAARIDMPARRTANALHVASGEDCDPASQARRMLHPYVVVGRERYDRVAGALGIEPRDPFLDVRLLAFCQSLPPEQLHGNGWAKLILRRVMAGHRPESVRWKRGRDHVGWRYTDVCIDHPKTLLADDTAHELLGLANIPSLAANLALQCNNAGVVSESDLIYLTSWLTEFKTTRD